MQETHLAERFKHFIAEATSVAASRKFLSGNFSYEHLGSRSRPGAWQQVNLWEHQHSTRTSQINLLGNVDISEIYVDAERGVVIACVRFMQIADPFEIDYVLHGVWIAHFDTDGSLNRLEDYSDIDYFGGRLPNTAER